MLDESEDLKSVNWISGMLLTPDHFRRQDAYVAGASGWILRYSLASVGLVGPGIRAGASQRGRAADDPQLEVRDDGTTVRLTVLQARGLTPVGGIVDITHTTAVRAEVPKALLGGLTSAPVYIVRTEELEADPSSVGTDAANPNQAALLRRRYEVRLDLPADLTVRALTVGRIRRAEASLSFELDPGFIPACATMLGHSALYVGWRRLHDEIVHLAGQFAELHRTVASYAELVARRGVDVRADIDILAFVERAVLALDECAYELLDPTTPPLRLFQQIDRTGRRASLALDLSGATRQFLQTMAGADASYGTLLDEERQALSSQREIAPAENLADHLGQAEQTVRRLRRLAEVLEGKYVDYRLNRSIDALRFLLDRDGEDFFVAVATPGHPQRDGMVLTFVFSEVSLTGQHEYRVVLVGDPLVAGGWQVGEELTVTVRVNAAAGASRPITSRVACELPGQRNFAVDFATPPDVNTITSIDVTITPGTRLRSAQLYQRRRGMIAARPGRAGQPAERPPQTPQQVVPPSPPESDSKGTHTSGARPVIRFTPPPPKQP